MTLKEMAAQYRANLPPWQERAALLRKEIAACTDIQQRLALERRLRMMQLICREGRETARYLETYYDNRRTSHGREETTGTLSDPAKQ